MKEIDKNNKVFCMAPWVHLHVWPNGSTYACCLHPPEHGELGNIKESGLSGVWNSDKMKQLRLNMLAETPTPEVCERCYHKEKTEFGSLRTWMNEYFYDRHNAVVDTTLEDGTVDKFNLVHWDFRFSNICNLKCRTCGPQFSSSWYDDEIIRFPTYKDPKIIRIVERNNPDFWALLDSIIPELESIHFAGGEPLMMEEHYKVLELLHKHKKYDIRVHYSTNFSFLNYKTINLIEQWRPFKSIEIYASLDGHGEIFEYLRKNAKWDVIMNNFARLSKANLPGVTVRIHCTVSIMNILHLPAFHRYVLDHSLLTLNPRYHHWATAFVINPVISPSHYSFSAIPPAVKKEAILRIEKHIDYLANNTTISIDGMESVISLLKNTKFNQADLDKFKIDTAELDAIRFEDSTSILSEVYALI